eukprot:sb/3469806/
MHRKTISTHLGIMDSNQQTMGVNRITTALQEQKQMMEVMVEQDMDVEELQNVYKELQRIQYRLESQKKAINFAKSKALLGISDTHAVTSLGSSYVESYEQAVAEEPEPQVTRISISSCQQPLGAVTPAQTHTTTNQQLDAQLEEDGIALAMATQSLKCPITLQLMVDPVESQCGHTYDKPAILSHIKNTRSINVRCPVAGCQGFVNVNSLKRNATIAALL